jgi:hypothetical protein
MFRRRQDIGRKGAPGGGRRILASLAVAASTLLPVAAALAVNPTPAAAAAYPAPAYGNSYWMTDAKGAVWPLGGAPTYGSLLGFKLASPIVNIVPTPDHHGYWLVAAAAACSASVTPSSTDRSAPSACRARSSRWPRPPTAAGTGW